ncbi:MAG: exodeoxyribonuclease V subunit gamma [Gammaproteobacteria bacterium]
MFILHSSNKTENLLEHLAAIIETAPLSSPFSKEVFLIQSQGMERWLSQQLATKLKVWGNFEYLFPGRFFSSLAQKIDSSLSDEAFERELMHWRFEALLRRLDGESAFTPLQRYLSGENVALKRYQLAGQLAQIFDQYQLMRPDVLSAWQQGQCVYETETERWQKALWERIIEATGNRHRGTLWLDVIERLTSTDPGEFAEVLPERVSVFGVNSMPPLFLEFLQGLARHIQVHLFLLNPAQTFWADLATKRQRLERDDLEGHPLLSILGQQGREFQQMLLEQAQFELELNSFEPGEIGNNLQQLQFDILNNQPIAMASKPNISGEGVYGADNQYQERDISRDGVYPAGCREQERDICRDGVYPAGCREQTRDDSLTIHACHTRMREVEVLKNQLLHALESDPELELRDIVVMAPDIEAYEPFISAVFEDIQHAIADRCLRLSNHALDAFITFLNLSQSRFGWLSVLDLLENPVVFPGFGLSETDLELIKFWIQDTHVRWGQSAQHKRELGLPELNENTWQAALDRLLMGYAVGTDDTFVLEASPGKECMPQTAGSSPGISPGKECMPQTAGSSPGILPYINIEGGAALALGGLHDFLQLLFKAGADLKHGKPLKAWGEQLYDYADQLLIKADPLERQQLNELLADLSQTLATVHDQPVELQVIISWLEGRLEEHKSSNGFLRGQLTFCSMLPMRSIPFKVIALMGMNDGEFPKIDRNPTFDLLGQDFRKGDRSRRADDRYQFLEILLSARQQLIITYIGQSISHNDAIPPSVVISELLDVLSNSYQLKDLVVKHSLQAFSPRYFEGTADVFSYSQADCSTASALIEPKIAPSLWWQGSIDIERPEETVVEIGDLFAFFRHPQKYFMQRQLDIRFDGIAADTEEREPFDLGRLDGYAIYHEWIDGELNDAPLSVHKLQAQGRWLSGVCGELEFVRQGKNIAVFVDRIKAKNLGASLEDLAVDMRIGRYRLIGKLGNRYQNGSLFYRYADLKGKDFLVAWLHHLIINRLEPQTTSLISTDEDLTFLPEHCVSPGMECIPQPADFLEAFIDLYRQGQTRPDAFFVEPALAYVKQAYKLENGNRATKSALEAATDQLTRAIEQSYETELRRFFLSAYNPEELLKEPFERHCRTLLQPAWNVTHR